jgi:hypothetical protein
VHVFRGGADPSGGTPCEAVNARSGSGRCAETDRDVRPGVSADEGARLKELERANRELRRANAILRQASSESRGQCNASVMIAMEVSRPRERLHHFGFDRNQLSVVAWQAYRNGQTEAVFAPHLRHQPGVLAQAG